MSWWERRLGEWTGTGKPGLKLVPVVATPVVEPDGARGGGVVSMQLPGGVALEFDVRHVAAKWVATVALEVSRGQ